MGVIAEALTAFVLADALVEKFGGDSLREMQRNWQAYLAQLAERWTRLADGAALPVEET
jgi:chorismate synthase